MSRPLALVKVGGSLYDLPDLASRLREWLAAEVDAGFDALLVPGGGAMLDRLRTLDRLHGLGEAKSHWLALRALTANAHFLAALLSSTHRKIEVRSPPRLEDKMSISILDVHEFARIDEERAGRLPPTWDVTSDSLAARAAVVFGAARLTLLKSVTIPAEMDWREAAARGFVDARFAETLRQASSDLQVRAVNLRTWPN